MLSKILYKKNAMPEYITFFITNKCNLKCKHCFLWKELNNTKNELTLDEIKKLSKSIGKFTVLVLTGGEPFLRKNIFEIIKIFYINNKIKYLNLPTNGTIHIKRLINKVLKECPKLNVRVLVSIDDLKERHDKIRGKKGTFNKAIETFNELKEIENKHLKVGIITTFSKLNENRIFHIYDWIETNLNPDFMNFPIIRGDVRNKTIKDINIDIYKKLVKRLNKRKETGIIGETKKIMNELNVKIIRENRYIIPCYAGIINAVIYSNGDVYPCELFNKRIGNLKHFYYNFKDIWASYSAEEIRDIIRKTKCFCIHGCNMLPNVLFNPKFTFKIAKNCLKQKILKGGLLSSAEENVIMINQNSNRPDLNFRGKSKISTRVFKENKFTKH